MSGINGKKAHPVQKLVKGGSVGAKKPLTGDKIPPMRKNKVGSKVKKQEFAPKFM